MTITLRTTKGSALTIAEIDGNFSDLDTRVTALEDAEPDAPTFDSDVVGNQWTLTINGNDYVMTIPQATYTPPGIVDLSASSATLGAGNANHYTRVGHATGCTLTVPPNASVALEIGTEMHFRQADDGPITIAPGAAVTVNAQFGCTLVTAGKGATITLKKVATNVWDAFGQFAAV